LEGLEQGVSGLPVGSELVKPRETLIAVDKSATLYMRNALSELRVQIDGRVHIENSTLVF